MTGVDISGMSRLLTVSIWIGVSIVVIAVLWFALRKASPGWEYPGMIALVGLGVFSNLFLALYYVDEGNNQTEAAVLSHYGVVRTEQVDNDGLRGRVTVPAQGKQQLLKNAVLFGQDGSKKSVDVTLRNEGNVVTAFTSGQDGTLVPLPAASTEVVENTRVLIESGAEVN